ncbi:MAG: 6-carboxytetrahydropterin synthase QueD [Actinomycetota bacterium]
MYELLIKAHFDAAHSLRGYPGDCAGLHGHTWRVEVVIEGEELNDIELLYDFRELKSQVDEVLSKFDHKYLNEVHPFDELSPTGENLARYLFEQLKATFPDGINLKKVSVWESEDACISYKESHGSRTRARDED